MKISLWLPWGHRGFWLSTCYSCLSMCFLVCRADWAREGESPLVETTPTVIYDLSGTRCATLSKFTLFIASLSSKSFDCSVPVIFIAVEWVVSTLSRTVVSLLLLKRSEKSSKEVNFFSQTSEVGYSHGTVEIVRRHGLQQQLPDLI